MVLLFGCCCCCREIGEFDNCRWSVVVVVVVVVNGGLEIDWDDEISERMLVPLAIVEFWGSCWGWCRSEDNVGDVVLVDVDVENGPLPLPPTLVLR